MSRIRFSAKMLEIDGAPGYLNSGEFHYFRVPSADWQKRMRLLREAGGNTLATYIPWLIHEPVEGTFRFDAGDGFTDIRRFLDTAAAEKLMVIARPGPYQYSELAYAGLPGWLCRNYPEVLSLDRNGKTMNYFSVSYLHPLFLEKAERYFQQICPILAEYSSTRGGPVVMVQPDNELGGIHTWMGDYDFHPVTMGFGREDGRYARYLAARFGTVEALNLRYGTAHGNFGAFGPGDRPKEGTAALLWARDYADFYCGTLGEYLETLIGMMTRCGIDVPFCHNAASPYMNTWFREAKARLGDKLLLGSDHYYSLSQTWPQNNPTPQYAMRCFLSNEKLRLMGNPPCVFEFPTGSFSDWPSVSGVDFTACALMHQAFGTRGHNGYIFTGGPNVPGTGTTSDIYDYGAPIGAAGEIRPTYHALKAFGAFVAARPELADSAPDADFRVLMPWIGSRSDSRWGTPDAPGVCEPGKSWEEFKQGLISTAFAGSLLPDLADPDTDAYLADLSTPVVLWCDGALSAGAQRRAVEFLKRGGSILCVPILPRYDEDYNECTTLTDYLGGCSSGPGVSPKAGQTRFNIAGVENVFGNSDYYPAVQIPEGAEILGVEALGGSTVAWQFGRFIFLGMSWSHGKTEQSQMLCALLERLGMRPRVIGSNGWVLTVLRKHRKGATLFVMNLGSSPQTTTLRVRPNGANDFQSLAVELPAMTVKTFDFFAGR